MKKYISMFMAVIFAVAPAFAQTTDDHEKTKKGAAIGGIAGAIAGAIIGNHKGNSGRGVLVGGVVGAATGAIVGNMMDKQERELRQIQGVDVTRTAPDEL